MKLSFKHSESEQALKDSALDFIKREAPHEVVRELQDSEKGYSEDMWRKTAELGWLGINIPEKYGGEGGTKLSAGALFEALGTAPLPGPFFSSAILGAEIILAVGSEEQKKDLLPDIARGKRIFTLALTESQYSWTPDEVQLTATVSGDGYVLNGIKLFVLDAPAATDFIVAARTGAGPTAWITLFLVNAKSKGLSVRRLPGYLAAGTYELTLDSVKVGQEDIIGKVNDAWAPLQQAIDRSIPVLCAYKVGGSQRLTEITIDYSRTRVQFGMPIGRFQRVQDLIIVQQDYADSVRWTTYEALWKLDENRPAQESIHLAKAVASEGYWEAATLAHRVFSGVSYSKKHPVSLHTKASRYLYNYLGEPAYHRQLLGKLLLGI
jgi:alkylation response protein AidB-like acyl-CoA dehydrogenase